MTQSQVIEWLKTKPLKFQQIEKELGLSSGQLTKIVNRAIRDPDYEVKRADGKETIRQVGEYFERTFKVELDKNFQPM
jgi:hypothetical protein